MTFVEKAIERLNKLIEQSAENSEEQIEYVVMKQACEKQVEKKIINQNNFYICPKCGACLADEWGGNYCLDCGQKIDWGDKH